MNHVKDLITLQHVISLAMQLSEDDRRQLLRYVREHTPYELDLQAIVNDDLFGTWPGDETDEELLAALAEMDK
jgi:hypothetical protein